MTQRVRCVRQLMGLSGHIIDLFVIMLHRLQRTDQVFAGVKYSQSGPLRAIHIHIHPQPLLDSGPAVQPVIARLGQRHTIGRKDVRCTLTSLLSSVPKIRWRQRQPGLLTVIRQLLDTFCRL